MIVISIIVTLLMLPQIPSQYNLNPLSWRAAANYSAMESLLESIPLNSTVMSQTILSAHLTHVLYLELPPDYGPMGFTPTGYGYLPMITFYRKPDYVVVDPALNDFYWSDSPKFNVYSYMDDNYTLYGSAGALKVYELKNG